MDNEKRIDGLAIDEFYHAGSMATKGDMYHQQILTRILFDGHKDENPRPRYSDGTPAHTFFLCEPIVQRYDLEKGECPLTTKRPNAWKSGVKEILWIYQMQSNRLSDLHDLGISYWDEWDIGDGTIGCRYGETVRKHGLIARLLDGLKKDPFGRRHIMSLWQEDDFNDKTGGTTKGLNPCCYETIWSCYRGDDGQIRLNMMLNQRSSDYEVSCSINEIQYIALLMMVAQHCGYIPGVFTHVIENVQIYDRHVDNVKEILRRDAVKCSPRLLLNPEKKDFYSFSIEDFTLSDYPLDEIKARNKQLVFDLGI